MITILISRFKLRPIVATTALALMLVACGSGDAEADDQLTVVATTSIWGDVLSEIVGDDARVEVLIPPGADPHDYQPTQQEVALLTDADLVVANGLGLEEGLHDVLEAAIAEGSPVYEIAPDLDPIPFGEDAGDDHEDEDEHDEEHDEHEDDEDGHDHGSLDPHVWFDPTRVALAAQFIADRLTEIDDSVDWHAAASTYAERLDEVDEEMQEIFEAVPADQRKLVTNHDSLGYLADRYDFDVVGVVIPGGSTLADPSSAELADLVGEIQEEEVTAIFTDSGQSADLADAVAAEVGFPVAVIELYTGSLGDEGSGAETLPGMLVTDARLIADGLS